MSDRKTIVLELLNNANGPISASFIARQLNVSRQSVVEILPFCVRPEQILQLHPEDMCLRTEHLKGIDMSEY